MISAPWQCLTVFLFPINSAIWVNSNISTAKCCLYVEYLVFVSVILWRKPLDSQQWNFTRYRHLTFSLLFACINYRSVFISFWYPYWIVTLVNSASRWIHWATRWRHSAVFVASSSASSQVMSISLRFRLTTSSQVFLGRPSFLLYPLSSHCIAWWGILEFSTINTCPSHFSLISLMMSSKFYNPVFFLISSFLTLFFHLIPNSFRWNFWCLILFYFHFHFILLVLFSMSYSNVWFVNCIEILKSLLMQINERTFQLCIKVSSFLFVVFLFSSVLSEIRIWCQRRYRIYVVPFLMRLMKIDFSASSYFLG